MYDISKDIEKCCSEILEKKAALLDIYMVKVNTIQEFYKSDPNKRREEKRKAERKYESELFTFVLETCGKYKLRLDYIFKIMHPSGINWTNSIKKSKR